MARRTSEEQSWVHTKSVAATGTQHSLFLWQQPVESPGNLITTWTQRTPRLDATSPHGPEGFCSSGWFGVNTA